MAYIFICIIIMSVKRTALYILQKGFLVHTALTIASWLLEACIVDRILVLRWEEE